MKADKEGPDGIPARVIGPSGPGRLAVLLYPDLERYDAKDWLGILGGIAGLVAEQMDRQLGAGEGRINEARRGTVIWDLAIGRRPASSGALRDTARALP